MLRKSLTVPFQRFEQSVTTSVNFEYFDCLIRRACCEPIPVVIEDGIMLRILKISLALNILVIDAHDHILMGCSDLRHGFETDCGVAQDSLGSL